MIKVWWAFLCAGTVFVGSASNAAAREWKTELVCWGHESDRYLVVQADALAWGMLRATIATEGPLLPTSRKVVEDALKPGRRFFLGPAHDVRELEVSTHRALIAGKTSLALWIEMHSGPIFTMQLSRLELTNADRFGRLLEHDLRWASQESREQVILAEGERFQCVDFDDSTLGMLTLKRWPAGVTSLSQALCESRLKEITQD